MKPQYKEEIGLEWMKFRQRICLGKVFIWLQFQSSLKVSMRNVISNVKWMYKNNHATFYNFECKKWQHLCIVLCRCLMFISLDGVLLHLLSQISNRLYWLWVILYFMTNIFLYVLYGKNISWYWRPRTNFVYLADFMFYQFM